ncbi:hypothetical protein F4679DRAFT_579845 [Xylaria curta]|nr:hypothetical protein F4679DRAFT_579845 [Xylaria curta]
MSLTPEQIEYYQEHASDTLQPNLISSAVVTERYGISFGGQGYKGTGLQPIAVFFSEGRHSLFVTNVPGFSQVYVVAITGYALCVILTKISILCFYRRIFSPVKSLKYSSWALGIFIMAYNVALVLVTALQCIPLSALWTGEPAKYINTLPPFTMLRVINVVTDVIILILPVRQVLKLYLSRIRRIQLSGIFLLGALVLRPAYGPSAKSLSVLSLPVYRPLQTWLLERISPKSQTLCSTLCLARSIALVALAVPILKQVIAKVAKNEAIGASLLISFAAGSASERGERDGNPPSRIVIKKEIVQMVQ